MGIYSDGKIYGVCVKTKGVEKELKITSPDPLTKQQFRFFYSEYSRLIDKSDTAFYFLKSVSTFS
jgi:hypothetical protein